MERHPNLDDGLPRELDDRGVAQLLARSAQPVVLASHWAGWECSGGRGPWPALEAADWRELAREFGERVDLARVETGASRATAARFGLEILPVVLVVVGGVVFARLSGRVRTAAVVAAVRAALERGRELEEAALELAASRPLRATPASVRSVLRSRASDAPVLARAS